MERMVSMNERDVLRTVQNLGHFSMPDILKQKPMPKSIKMMFVCLECGTKFSSSNSLPSCRNCGGSDVDLA